MLRSRREEELVQEWLREQLDLIASKVLFEYFLAGIFGRLDELSVNSIVFSDRYAIFESAGSVKNNRTPGEDLSRYLAEVLGRLSGGHLPPRVAGDLLGAILYRISSQVFNALLASDHPDTVTIRRGFQIKMALSELESWAYRQGSAGGALGKLVSQKMQQHFAYIKAACMVIVFATNADIFASPEAVEMFSPLSVHQILCILRRFHPDATAPEKVPPSVFSHLEASVKKSGPPSDLLLPPILKL